MVDMLILLTRTNINTKFDEDHLSSFTSVLLKVRLFLFLSKFSNKPKLSSRINQLLKIIRSDIS